MFLDSILEVTKLVASGAVGGAVAAWSNWGVEKRRSKLAYRREAYFSLKPHLLSETLDALNTEKKKETLDVVIGARKTTVNPPDRLVRLLTDDIARVEGKWDLV